MKLHAPLIILFWSVSVPFTAVASEAARAEAPPRAPSQCAAEKPPKSLETTSLRFPGERWLMYASPEEAGWSGEKLREAWEYFETINSSGVLVVYDGAVLVAWGEIERRFLCHSIRKSLLSALYGVHVAESTIDTSKTLAELNIDDVPPLTHSEKRARVIDLLKSRSGIYHPAAYETEAMKNRRPERGSHEPGEFFWYNNWDFNALCTIFEQETGTRVFEEFQRRFAVPLGMEDFRLQDTYYHLESEHSMHPAYPFRMSARDLARLGLLFLREGRWRGKQILTPDWVRRSTASHFRAGDTASNSRYGYGYLWWRIVDGPFASLGMYSARGYGGHAVDVLPGADLVLVHRVDTFWDLSLPFGRQKRRVKDSERFRLLELVLNARVCEPQSHPVLIPLKSQRGPSAIVRLDPRILQEYVGEYDFEDFRLRVKLAGDGLLIGDPAIGDFSLVPRSRTKFIVEDLDAPVVFELDPDGNPRRLVGEFAPDRKRVGRRSACPSRPSQKSLIRGF